MKVANTKKIVIAEFASFGTINKHEIKTTPIPINPKPTKKSSMSINKGL